MNVYVSELPSCCEDCVCHNGVSGRCKLLHRTTFDIPPIDCPLQSLADHDKQVRKEVCDEIRNRHHYILYDDGYEFNEETGDWETVLKTFDYNLTEEDLKELEQGETK